ncbi:hypothetical protein E8E15_010487 [Penicillium rubens]|nr:hypothetical protein E8E15_010487 [Penicillium rubens]KAJ5044282.1 hypothetical protein NUH16_001083 [Penicillium rubens]
MPNQQDLESSLLPPDLELQKGEPLGELLTIKEVKKLTAQVQPSTKLFAEQKELNQRDPPLSETLRKPKQLTLPGSQGAPMDSYHVENQTPQVAMAQASGQAVDILDADDDRLSNWDEQDLMYEVQSQDQYTNMINLPDGIESIYPVDLTRPMTETLQLVYATQGGKRPREEDSRTESPPPVRGHVTAASPLRSSLSSTSSRAPRIPSLNIAAVLDEQVFAARH